MKPLARSTDPDTSHIAAHEFVNSGKHKTQCEQILELVKAHPGLTSSELAEKSNGMFDRYQVQRRLSDMKGAEVRRGESEYCRITGRLAKTWWPND